MTDARGDRTAQALSAFLVDRAHLLLPLATQLGETPTEVESAIRGSSMAPAIPPRSRLRVRVGGQIPCQVGDVVFYLADDGYTAHRVVYRAAGGDYLLAEGDARFAPDPPLSCRQVLGTVVAVEIDGQWLPVGGSPARPWRQRLVRGATLAAMIAVSRLSTGAAKRLAALLLTVETKGRMTRRRLLHGRSAPDPSASAGRGKGA
ncbi:MAG TPA: S24/S26 family peptidase [Candidatus Dormibacteraeota bacterium]|nr:S24/S26 family peptidase [Candidatus Dormibacteraeota bacterium]